MDIAPFQTEQFFARFEFNTPFQLCNSDCETVSVEELLRLAGRPLEALGRQRLGYGESRGGPDLRRAIASCYRSVDPDEVVALGAAIQGYALVTSEPEQKSETLLLDVTPHSLGIMIVGGYFHTLIEKNTTVPATSTSSRASSPRTPGRAVGRRS